MDTLEIKIIDRLDLKEKFKNIDIIVKDFYEFYINGEAFSTILTEFCKSDDALLNNWIGILGSFSNRQMELNSINRLLLKPVLDGDIKKVFPANMSKKDLDVSIADYKRELADEKIIIYGCRECGGYDCGGFKIAVTKEGDFIKWTFLDDDEQKIDFLFNKHLYFQVFDDYIKKTSN